jgi:hypothetical protein
LISRMQARLIADHFRDDDLSSFTYAHSHT